MSRERDLKGVFFVFRHTVMLPHESDIKLLSFVVFVELTKIETELILAC